MRNSASPIRKLPINGGTFLKSIREWLIIRPLGGILLLGLMAGTLCFAVIPPWWHYDEPGHFEYVWLAAHSPTWPVPGQYDQPMRRQMALSMLHYNWYGIRNFKPDLHGPAPIPIGVTQVGDQPGYYFLASLPLRIMPNAPIIVQYNAARLVSLLLFLLILVVVWYALGEILPGNHPLRWMVTVFIAVLPAFVDTMVSVNNDVGAVLAASICLWASLRLIRRGYSPGRMLFLIAGLAACYLSKSTAWFTFVLVPLALVLAALRGRFTGLIWSVAVIALFALAALALKWSGAVGWYQDPTGDDSPRIRTSAAPVGSYAFGLDDSASGGQLLQVISPDTVMSLRGKTATLGAWLWANQPTQAGPFFIRFWTQGGPIVDSSHVSVDATSVPAFHQITVQVPSDAAYAIIFIQQTPHNLSHNTVFWDGVILTPGQFGIGLPHFTDANGAEGIWMGQRFNNLLQNASAEQGSFQLRKWVDDKTNRVLSNAGVSIPLTLTIVQDWRATAWYFRDMAATLFRTFWTSLAGDKAVLQSVYIGYFLLLLTLSGVAGSVVWLWQRRRTLRWDVIGFLGISLMLSWLSVLAKGNLDFLRGAPLFPWARYAFPAILPTSLVLCAGWLQWLEIVPVTRKAPAYVKQAIFLCIMLGISFLAIMNAAQIFHPVRGVELLSLAFLIILLYAIFLLAPRQDAQASLKHPA